MKNLVWGILLMLFAFANAYQWSLNQPVRRVRWGLNQERVYYSVPQGMTAQEYFSQLMMRGDQSYNNQNLEKSGISDREEPENTEAVNGMRSCHCGKCLRCILGRRPVVQGPAVAAPEVQGNDKVDPDHSGECKCGSCNQCLLKQQEQKPSARLFGFGGGGYTGMGGGGYPGMGYDPYYSRPSYGYGYPEYYESYYEGAYPYEDPYYRPYNW